MEVDSDNVGSDENSGGLSPSSDDGGNDGGNVEAGGSDDEGEQMHNDPYEEMPLHRRDHNLIDVTMHRSDYQEPYYQQSSHDFLVMSLDKELHEMVVGMTMKIMLSHAILICGNN
ncbi:hypothetical protein Lal_00026658 [Lupinus albus]|nr:hypothetical protein Lal_00026658 [Lupinus albus]